LPTLDLMLAGLNADEVSVRLGPGRTGEAAWSASLNTRFQSRVLESVRGEADIYPGGGPAGGAIWGRGSAVGGQPWFLYVTLSGIGSFDGTNSLSARSNTGTSRHSGGRARRARRIRRR
jgi:hypothetical protein